MNAASKVTNLHNEGQESLQRRESGYKTVIVADFEELTHGPERV
jgi:hypothetical protein